MVVEEVVDFLVESQQQKNQWVNKRDLPVRFQQDVPERLRHLPQRAGLKVEVA